MVGSLSPAEPPVGIDVSFKSWCLSLCQPNLVMGSSPFLKISLNDCQPKVKSKSPVHGDYVPPETRLVFQDVSGANKLKNKLKYQKSKLLCYYESLKNLVQNSWNKVVCFHDTTTYVSILSAVAVTSLEIGNSLSYWNLESKHSSRMKLLKMNEHATNDEKIKVT